MDTQSVAPVVLVILDGWGYRDALDGNAVLSAHTPVMDSLWAAYPHTLLEASGRAVGLPAGQMGNSEVGHLTLGAGRVVPQELVRISDAVETGSLFQEPLLVDLCRTLKERRGRLHLLGLCSKGGVHSHIDHLYGLLKLAAQAQVPTYIHAITDGRDTLPREGATVLAALQKELDLLGNGVIATLSGRYYAMDRDRRWDRIQKAYEVMTQDGPGQGRSAAEVMEEFYSQDLTDEFIPPTRLAPGAIQDGDGVIFFNFRPDRARQLTHAFVSPDFSGFERPLLPNLTFITMTQYEADLPVEVLFKPQNLDHLLGQVVSEANLKQLRIAETEKYAHVTYFFNGGIEQPFPGEDRILVQSPMVTTYDQAPEMSAIEVTEKVVEAIARREYSLVILNYANPDMVGHTGNYEATVRALETVDQCIGKLLAAVVDVGGTTLILADHGNAEVMWDEDHNPWTAHTTNPVPCILVEGEGRKIPGYGGQVKLRSDGTLADVAPTLLQILGLPQPQEMTGRSLLHSAEFSVQRRPAPVVR
ncbi:2,3-bisphosphoglycerate-independent phosphoglycerate mutase [Thermostichus vulcanus]|uniref:2,3-bisphosphoglycerate-independent phosphoglycerate mutase n=1 Tax=Thermostichus vulcanus str. 'Rupite' TaxID=2813851 RepID=A0ABT0CBW3_THEVL|nr:2,3-bisphosphoglycerate-independent phosphoglycerate mutase [Thermostichus vulcanus]MCJ2543273.1 2,3-bisphosphoglycerate-independent phosphoglycerate mutase [Thermostichus vulcanus str. 'Rupite']